MPRPSVTIDIVGQNYKKGAYSYVYIYIKYINAFVYTYTNV